MLPRRVPLLVTFLAAALCSAPAVASAAPVQLPSGRTADPAGRLTPLEAFPTGVAVSPDGRTVLAIAGPAIQGGEGGAAVELHVVDAATGVTRQLVKLDDGFQDVVFAADGGRAYVAGGSSQTVQELDVGPGGVVTAGPSRAVGAFVAALAPTPDGRAVWVGEPEAGRVQLLDLASGSVSRSLDLPNPNQLALAPDGRTLYATDWRGAAVSVVDLATGRVASVRTGLHPTDVAVAADGQVVVADAGDATLASLGPGDTRARITDLAQLGRRTDAPNAVVLGPGGRAYVSLGGDDAVAVLDRRAGGYRQVGLIPTGWYPDALALGPDGGDLHVVTARGLGHSAAATSPFVDPDPVAPGPDSAYLTAGTLETVALPGDRAGLDRLTARARATLRRQAPRRAGANPVLAGPRGPIRHVVYVTRENKTYDAVLGDLHPGRPGNALTLFGRDVTPNLHALQTQFAESDRFSYQGFASVTGHMWEDAGAVSDVFERSVASNTGTHLAHGNTSWRDATNYPATGLLTEQAYRAGLSVRTYNEELAQQSHLLPDAVQASPGVFPDYDLHTSDVRREAGWESEFRQFEAGRCTGELVRAYGAACDLPALEYVYLGEDHTTVVDQPGYPTIQAQVADNDLATARIVDAISHSRFWRSTVVIVVEDDPQGTGDSVSSYRGILALASPWVRRGAVSHTPYDLTSVVGAIDRILGLEPITDFALTSRPLDDLFTTRPDDAPFTADESGARRYPFTPLPGVRPASDPRHGIYSFTEPDMTDPAVAGAATWRQVKGAAPLPLAPGTAALGALLPPPAPGAPVR